MANLNTYDVGSLVSVIGKFYDKATPPQLQDPTTVTLKVKDPTAGSYTSYTFVGGGVLKDSQGVYRRDLDTSAKPGKWLYRWESTGIYQAAGDNAFLAKASPLSP